MPLGVAQLQRLGISAKAASYYVKQGWLVRLGHGVYAFPGDPLTAHGCVKFLQEQVGGLHVGGKAALALQGVRHNLAPREKLVLWGEKRFVLPSWLTSRFPARYVHAKLFEWPNEKLGAMTITTPPDAPEGLRVSTPERAALELLYDVGTDEGLEESRHLFQGLSNLRSDITGQLLSCCTSVKTVRLFLLWAGEMQLLDVGMLVTKFSPRTGSARRWISRMPDGTLLTLKPHG